MYGRRLVLLICLDLDIFRVIFCLGRGNLLLKIGLLKLLRIIPALSVKFLRRLSGLCSSGRLILILVKLMRKLILLRMSYMVLLFGLMLILIGLVLIRMSYVLVVIFLIALLFGLIRLLILKLILLLFK